MNLQLLKNSQITRFSGPLQSSNGADLPGSTLITTSSNLVLNQLGILKKMRLAILFF